MTMRSAAKWRWNSRRSRSSENSLGFPQIFEQRAQRGQFAASQRRSGRRGRRWGRGDRLGAQGGLAPLARRRRGPWRLGGRAGRGRRGANQSGGALLFQQFLHPLDRVSLAVEQALDRRQQLDVLRPIISTTAAALQGLDLREARFPEPQHMLR